MCGHFSVSYVLEFTNGQGGLFHGKLDISENVWILESVRVPLQSQLSMERTGSPAVHCRQGSLALPTDDGPKS